MSNDNNTTIDLTSDNEEFDKPDEGSSGQTAGPSTSSSNKRPHEDSDSGSKKFKSNPEDPSSDEKQGIKIKIPTWKPNTGNKPSNDEEYDQHEQSSIGQSDASSTSSIDKRPHEDSKSGSKKFPFNHFF